MKTGIMMLTIQLSITGIKAEVKYFHITDFTRFFYEINAALVKLLSAMGSKYYINKKVIVTY